MVDGKVWDPEMLVGAVAPVPAVAAHQFRDESGWSVYMHEDFFEWLVADDIPPAHRRRARYCLRELLISGTCARRKNVQGAAKGWLRTQLGGSGGSHFYLWWAPQGYPAVDGTNMQKGDVLVRAVRHHDDTDKPLDPGDSGSWHLVDAQFVLDDTNSDLTPEQLEASAPGGPPVRLVKGYPGSGKTTALLQAGSYTWASKALYMTFSKRLARESESYFRTFAPLDTSVDVLTFGELLVELGADTVGGQALSVRPGGPQLAEALRMVKGQLGPWAARPDELYAELHAFAVGHAVPIPFGGLPASIGATVEPKALELARSATLGDVASGRVAFAAGQLAERGLVDELFPTLRAARRLLDTSADELPIRFQEVSAVLVDEVQDLTVAEAMLVLTLVARIGRASGRMPQLIVAGDEAQTVRPTAFQWSWFANLVTAVLGKNHSAQSEVSLTSNMRSPRAIAQLIEATRSHYRLLEKDARPGGLTYTEAETEHEGQVLYCHIPTAEGWVTLTDLFKEQPSAQLVFPGSTVPQDLAGSDIDIAVSDQVKGLDFDLVGVVDAGERQAQLEVLAAKAADDRLAGALGRTLADQYRVAISRARENLVLLDRGDEDHALAIHGLMAGVEVDPVVRVEIDALAAALQSDVNALDRLIAQLDDVAAILEDEPLRALSKARTATDLLRQAEAAEEVPAPQAADVHRLHGLAATLSAQVHDALADGVAARGCRAEAREAFGAAGLTDTWLPVSSLEHAVLNGQLHEIDPRIVLAAVRVHPDVVRTLGPLGPSLRATLGRWVSAVALDGLPRGELLDAGLSASLLAVEILEYQQPELAGLRADAIGRTARQAEAADDYEQALRCYEELEEAATGDLGRCLEQLDRWDEAATLYEAAGDGLAALRCVREIPDLERATVLAETVDPSVVGRLRWAGSLRSSVDPELTDEGPPLTRAERDHLLTALADGVTRAVDATPTPGAAVDRLRQRLVAPAGDHGAEAEVVALMGVPQSEESAAALATQPARPSNTTELIELGPLCLELGIDLATGREWCKKLGIRAVGPNLTITDAQAGRLRRRVAGPTSD